MNEAAPANARTPFPAFLFGFSGRIGPTQYWITIGIALAFLVAAVAFAAAAMAPTGGGAPLLGVPLFCLFVWLIASAMAQRLRDAGKNPWLALAFLAGLIAWQFLALELIEVASLLGIVGFFGILAVVGHIDTLPKMKEETRDAG
jgi:uncharacterized membrane protein YhaH (DUF805 family)